MFNISQSVRLLLMKGKFNMNDEIKGIKEIEEYTTPKTGKKQYKLSMYAGKDENGKSILIRKKRLTEKQALELYYKYKMQIASGEYKPVEHKRMHFKELFDMWVKVYADTVEESTLATTTNIFNNHILPVLSNIYVDKLTVAKCQKVAQEWRQEAPRTFKRYIRYVNNVLDYGVNLELLASNPMRKIVRPKVKRQVRKKFDDYYNKEELETFLNDCKAFKSTKIFTFFRVLAYSGMRKEEMLALTWEDIDFHKNTISINKALKMGLKNRLYVDTTKTADSVRVLNMDSQTMNYLREWKQVQLKELFQIGINALNNQAQLVFSNSNNSYIHPSKPREWNMSVCEKYNLRFIKIHGFRHTHASLLFRAGVTPKEVQKRLGHKKIETTLDIYTHVYEDESTEAIDKLANFMSN